MGGGIESGGIRRSGDLLYLRIITASPMNQITPSPKALELARRVLRIEANAVAALVDRIDGALPRGTRTHPELPWPSSSAVSVSGQIRAQDRFATFAAPARRCFVHPAEASHGDLGMITRDDVPIALSNSGRAPNRWRSSPSSSARCRSSGDHR